ncbi:MAG: hypothetical protein R3D80_06005 [Paracoccaceae bacterium]
MARGAAVTHVEASITEWDWAPEAFDLVVAVFNIQVPRALRAGAQVFDGMIRTLTRRRADAARATGRNTLACAPRSCGRSETSAVSAGASFAGLEILALESYDREIDEAARATAACVGR